MIGKIRSMDNCLVQFISATGSLLIFPRFVRKSHTECQLQSFVKRKRIIAVPFNDVLLHRSTSSRSCVGKEPQFMND